MTILDTSTGSNDDLSSLSGVWKNDDEDSNPDNCIYWADDKGLECGSDGTLTFEVKNDGGHDFLSIVTEANSIYSSTFDVSVSGDTMIWKDRLGDNTFTLTLKE